MRLFFNVLLLSFIGLFLTSCATGYKLIDPSSVNFPAVENNFSYKFDVLREAGNRKLSRKEERKLVRIVAIKLINNTGKTLKYGDNFKFYSDTSELNILSTAETVSRLKQSVPSYLLYLALTPAKLTVSSGYRKSTYPAGFIVGPAIAGINMAIAAKANKNFRTEMQNNNIIDKEIKAGETFYGLIGIYDNHFMPITVKTFNL